MGTNLTETRTNFPIDKYGTEKLGKLKSVMLHTPETSIGIINKKNYKYYLFNQVPDQQKFISEHFRYSQFLKSLGLEVFQLSGFVSENTALLNKLPNLTYSFIPLEPNVIIHYDFSLNTQTQSTLNNRGVKIIKFHPDPTLLAGGGSLRFLP